MTKEKAAIDYASVYENSIFYKPINEAFLAGVEWVEQKKKDSIKAGDWELDR